MVKKLSVISIDRLGRSLKDILNTIHYFTEKGISIHFISQSFSTIDENGKENPVSKLLISVLGMVSELERSLILERQRDGIRLAVLRGVFKGRRKGAKEDVLKFLSKSKNAKALDYLKKGLKNNEVCRLTGLSENTVTKIKKLGLNCSIN